MAVVSTESMPVKSEPDVVSVRRRVREVSAQLGLSLVDQTKIITAASELARNTIIYGGGGSMQVQTLNGPRVGLRLTFEDQGPAFPTSTSHSATVLPPVPDWVWVWEGPSAW